MVVVGVAVTEEPVVLLRPVAGDHAYEVELPDAVRVVLCPWQIEVLGLNVMVGGGFTLTVTCAVHPPGFPVTVYVVVVVGDAVTEEPIVALKPVGGLHEYMEAPVAVRVVDWPTQMAEGLLTKTGGEQGSGGRITLSGQPPPLKITSGPISSSAPCTLMNAG